MKIILLTVGKNGDRQISQLIDRYVSRLEHYARFEFCALPDVKTSARQNESQQKIAEGQAILDFIGQSDTVFLLDEKGKEYTSREFAGVVEKYQIRGTKNLVFVIGGPFGFSQAVYNRADGLVSLSKMTLTHEMVRLFFVEQLYRAFTIIRGENYHHD